MGKTRKSSWVPPFLEQLNLTFAVDSNYVNVKHVTWYLICMAFYVLPSCDRTSSARGGGSVFLKLGAHILQGNPKGNPKGRREETAHPEGSAQFERKTPGVGC